MPRSMVFIVKLSKPASQISSVGYATRPGTAGAPHDYTHVSGRVIFMPGDSVRQIIVPIRDVQYGPDDRWFEIELSNPSGVNLDQTSIKGVIPGVRPLSQPVVSVNNPVAA